MTDQAPKKPRRPRDANQLAKRIVDLSTGGGDTLAEDSAGKNPAAVALGSLGGKRGGAARAKSLSPDRRREIAKQAAAKRWARKKTEQSNSD